MAFINERDEVDPDFASAMVGLAAAYPTAKLTTELVRTYARALDHVGLEADQVRGLFGKAIIEKKWFPAVAELVQMVRPSEEDAAVLAWSALLQAAAEVGAWASLDVENGRTAEAVKAVFGSWPTLCREAEDGPALVAKRVAFLAAYRQAGRRTVVAARLAGLCEAGGGRQIDGCTWSASLTAGGRVVPQRDTRKLLKAGDLT